MTSKNTNNGSEIAFTAEYPKDWKVQKLKYTLRIKSGDAISVDDFNDEGEYEVYGGNGFIAKTNKFNSDKDDLVIGRVGAKCGNVRYIKGRKWVSDNALIANTSNDYAFMAYLLEALNLNNLANKSAQPLITGTLIRNCIAAFPPVIQQTRIVDYLNKKSQKLDFIIQQKEILLEKLQAKKQAIISEAITRGINSSIDLKRSSTIFLDFVPSSWTELKFKYLIRNGHLEIQDGNHGEIHPTADDYVDEGIPFVMANNVKGSEVDLTSCKFLPKEKTDRLRIGFAVEGDVLLTHKGTIGRTAIVGKINFDYLMLTPQVTYYR
ncbi:MAG: hypothetical protein EOO43_26770, partial [Flavobacterium sp.]